MEMETEPRNQVYDNNDRGGKGGEGGGGGGGGGDIEHLDKQSICWTFYQVLLTCLIDEIMI